MKKIFTHTTAIVLLCLFIVPQGVSATCYSNTDYLAIQEDYAARGLSGSGLEREAIDDCLRQIRAQDSILRSSALRSSAYNSGLYQIKLDYFYKLDAIEKELNELGGSDPSYVQCLFSSGNCAMSIRIPSDPTILDPDVFLSLMEYKEKCNVDLLQCVAKKQAPTQPTQPTEPTQPTKTQDQICSDKFGSNWKWTGGTTCGCKDGYVKKNGACVTYDQSCNISFPNTYFTKIDETGSRLCACKTGYAWNEQRTACVYVPPKTNNQICQDAFGSNSNWDGNLSDKGTPLCNCATGYEWNASQASCVYVPPKTNDQICQDVLGSNSNWDGTKCVCQDGYAWNTTRTTCILNQPKNIVVPPTKQAQEPIIESGQIESDLVVPSVTHDQGSIIKNKQIEEVKTGDGQMTIANTDNEPTKEIPRKKGLFGKAWSWFKGLFDF